MTPTQPAKPILFSAPMVRAILDGSKTQTRRIVKPQPPANTVAMGRWQDPGPKPAYWAFLRDGPVQNDHPFGGAELHGEPWRCPYGQPGGKLWVRETFGFGGDAYVPDIYYRASSPDAPIQGRWHPSIHMFRADSRITLEITGVRIERLQDISRGDAMAEGCPFPNMAKGDDPCQWYAQLWEEINGLESWASNPWVWVVGFQRLTP